MHTAAVVHQRPNGESVIHVMIRLRPGTETRRRALQVLLHHGALRPEEFWAYVWPMYSPRGQHKLLWAWIHRNGLIQASSDERYQLSPSGRRVLACWELWANAAVLDQDRGEATEIRINEQTIVVVDGIDAPHLEVFAWRMRGGLPMTATPRFFGRGALAMHRLILRPRRGLYVEHVDGNRFDHRRANLRAVRRIAPWLHPVPSLPGVWFDPQSRGFATIHRGAVTGRARLAADLAPVAE